MSDNQRWHDPTREQRKVWNDKLDELLTRCKELQGEYPDYKFHTQEYRDANDAFRRHYNSCPECKAEGSGEVLNYDMMWHDGDIVCTKCECYIRRYDAG